MWQNYPAVYSGRSNLCHCYFVLSSSSVLKAPVTVWLVPTNMSNVIPTKHIRSLEYYFSHRCFQWQPVLMSLFCHSSLLSHFSLTASPCLTATYLYRNRENVAVGLRNAHLFCTAAIVKITPRVSPIWSYRGENSSARRGWERTGRQKFYSPSVPDIILIKQMDND